MLPSRSAPLALRQTLWSVAACACLLLGGVGAARAQVNDQPREFEGVGITEHLGDSVKLDLPFRDETGAEVRLADYFKGDKPVIVTLVYFNCPMLCNLLLNGFVEGMTGIDYVPGKDFRVVTVSIDPREGPELAAAKKKNYLAMLGKPEAAAGWHFLTGKDAEVKALADTIGFGFRYDPDRMEYAHGAAIFLASPDGVLTRYLYGFQFEPKTLRLGLVEAGEGRIGTATDKFLLRCFIYDPDSRKYGFYIWGAMRLGGLLTIVILGTMLFIFWRRERRQGYGAA